MLALPPAKKEPPLKRRAAALPQRTRAGRRLQNEAREMPHSNKTGRSVTGLLRNTAGTAPALIMHEGWCGMNNKNSSSCLDRKIRFGLRANPSYDEVQNLPGIRSKIKAEIAYFGVNSVARPFLSRGLTLL